MENSTKKSSYKVVLKSTWPDVWKFWIQENQNWKRWDYEVIELPASAFVWMQRQEATQFVKQYLNWEMQMPEKKFEPESIIESMEVSEPRLLSSRSMQWFYKIAAVAIVWIVWWVLSVWTVINSKWVHAEEYIMPATVDELRWERDMIYDSCLNTCKMQRLEYDNKVLSFGK